jgi:hypothetical protein
MMNGSHEAIIFKSSAHPEWIYLCNDICKMTTDTLPHPISDMVTLVGLSCLYPTSTAP